MRRWVFRLCEPVAVLLYTFGLWAPWERYLSGHRSGTTWLAMATLLARTGWLSLPAATFAITLAALGCAAAGAALGVWSTAQRNLDSPRNHAWARWVFGCAVSILMPASGAAVFVILLAALEFALARAGYDATQAPARPQWRSSVLAEAFPIAFTACLAVLLWRYNAQLLIRFLLICYGAGLVLRAIVRSTVPGPAA